MRVYIMRGIPGSGKSTWIAKNLPSTPLICSADHYHMVWEDGREVYRFQPEKIKEAHDSCFRKYLSLLTTPLPEGTNIVVDNTNLKQWEIAPYYRAAEAMRRSPIIVHCFCDPIEAERRGLHNLPPGKVKAMWMGTDSIPDWWNVLYVNTDPLCGEPKVTHASTQFRA